MEEYQILEVNPQPIGQMYSIERANADIQVSTAKMYPRDLKRSCEMGRRSFANYRGVNLDSDSFTILEFIDLTKRSYGSEIIRELERRIKDET